MTGMDVLRRVHAYAKEMDKLKLRRLCAHDAMTRCTRSTDITGYGGPADKLAQYAARVDAVDRAIQARKRMYDMELDEALELIEGLTEPSQGVVMYRGWICGMTVRQTAAELRISESSVRGLRRRGREVLEVIGSKLEKNRVYCELESIFDEGKHAH